MYMYRRLAGQAERGLMHSSVSLVVTFFQAKRGLYSGSCRRGIASHILPKSHFRLPEHRQIHRLYSSHLSNRLLSTNKRETNRFLSTNKRVTATWQQFSPNWICLIKNNSVLLKSSLFCHIKHRSLPFSNNGQIRYLFPGKVLQATLR